LTSAACALPEGPATPSSDELYGGFHEVVFGLAILVVFVILIAVAIDAAHYHSHHHWWHECEGHWHHHAPPSSTPAS
jgi:hypothetical protein